MIRLGILDDDLEIRRLLKKILDNDEIFTVLESYDCAESFLEKANFQNLDLIISDIGLPGMSGVDFVKKVKTQYPHLKIIMFTIFEDNQNLFYALQAGASGYLLKDSSILELKEGILKVIEGGVIMGPNIGSKMLAFFSQSKPLKFEDHGLSIREIDVANLLVKGFTNKQIGSQLFISEETVKWHLKNIYSKASVHNRLEFIKKINSFFTL
jgi:DNA-binding NarL/FixJ family response regulator